MQSVLPGPERMARQLRFLVEVDRLKEIYRRTVLIGSRRRENSAEHSWHVTLLALTLYEYSAEPVDLLRVVRMLAVHDIVEIDAGDTFAYADQSSKAELEALAAARIFGLLPPDQCAEFTALWQEFDARETAEARYANAMDRLMPVLHNYYTEGGTWREHGVRLEAVMRRLSPIGEGAPEVWALVQTLLDEAVARGDILL